MSMAMKKHLRQKEKGKYEYRLIKLIMLSI